MADYRLTQTGEQVQGILNQQPVDHNALDAHVENGTIHVTAANKTAWDGKYNKPSGGIPVADLANAVQEALQAATSAYQKPANGIPSTDLDAAVREALTDALSAYQKPGGGIPVADLANAVQEALQAATSAYQKPSGGIPATDMSASVQSALSASSGMQASIDAERDARTAADLNLSNQIGTKLSQEQVQTIVNAAVRDLLNATQVQNLIDAALTDYSTTAEVSLAINQALSDYITTAQASTIIATTVSAAMSSYYTKQQTDSIVSGLNTAINTKANQSDVNTALAAKADTSTVNTALATKANQSDVNTALATKADQSAVNTALATKANQSDMESALATKATVTDLNAAKDRVLFLEQGLGKYDNVSSITLSRATAGKYVNTDGQEVSDANYGISSQVSLNAGDIFIVPSASAVPASVSVFARIVTRSYDKVINYIYTYRQDYPTLPLTATADYDTSLVYTAVYDETGETPTLTGWTRGGTSYTTLPATRPVAESYYEPLMKQSVAAIPSTGYYVYLCPTSMTIVVSGYTATVNGGVAHVIGLGIFKNIATNFIGAPGQSVLAQAFADLFGSIEGLQANLRHLGSCKATCIDFEDLPKVCGEALVVNGAGAPSVVPMFVGQRYHDTTNRKVYEAFSVTNSTNDWVLLN